MTCRRDVPSLKQRQRGAAEEPPETSMKMFPQDLARVVAGAWHSLRAGESEPPPCPPEQHLRELLEVVYLAACSPEEDRYPQFNIVALPATKNFQELAPGRMLPFDEQRRLSFGELRRLAPAVDIERSAIWVEWTKEGWRIAGLVDLGSSWHRARIGLEYRYKKPSCLVLQVERPGRIKVYQGEYRVATLTDGEIDVGGIETRFRFAPFVHDGLAAMSREIDLPNTQEFTDFQLVALLNVFGSIANAISLSGHGGALIILPSADALPDSSFKLKYRQDSSFLRRSFIDFINTCAPAASEERAGKLTPAEELRARDAFLELTETSVFIAKLSGCDGAILLTADARLVGFGCELRAGFREGTRIVEVGDGRAEDQYLDIEQFGMRHRSAVNLVSQEPHCYAMVVSQDGPISAVWPAAHGTGRPSGERKVLFRRGISFVNASMPWA